MYRLNIGKNYHFLTWPFFCTDVMVPYKFWNFNNPTNFLKYKNFYLYFLFLSLGHNDCRHCGKVFVGSHGKRDYEAHLKKHLVKETVCKSCNKDYKSQWNLKRHIIKCKKRNQMDLQQTDWRIMIIFIHIHTYFVTMN